MAEPWAAVSSLRSNEMLIKLTKQRLERATEDIVQCCEQLSALDPQRELPGIRIHALGIALVKIGITKSKSREHELETETERKAAMQAAS